MNEHEVSYSYRFFEEEKEKIREKGYYWCSNPELWNDLYDAMKPEFPTLYKYEGKSGQHLIVLKEEKPDEIVEMIERKQRLQKEVNEMNQILEHLGLNPEEY